MTSAHEVFKSIVGTQKAPSPHFWDLGQGLISPDLWATSSCPLAYVLHMSTEWFLHFQEVLCACICVCGVHMWCVCMHARVCTCGG